MNFYLCALEGFANDRSGYTPCVDLDSETGLSNEYYLVMASDRELQTGLKIPTNDVGFETDCIVDAVECGHGTGFFVVVGDATQLYSEDELDDLYGDDCIVDHNPPFTGQLFTPAYAGQPIGVPVCGDAAVVPINKKEENNMFAPDSQPRMVGRPYREGEAAAIAAPIKATNFGVNFQFGQVNDGKIKLSVYGVAYRSEDGRYCTYNTEDMSSIDVTEFLIPGMDGMVFKVPCELSKVKAGDTIVHMGNYVIVKSVEGNEIHCVNPYTRTTDTVIPSKSPFGFNFVTRVENLSADLISGLGLTAEGDDPLSAMLPLMLMSGQGGVQGGIGNMLPLLLMSKKDGEGTGDMSKLLPLMLMSGQGGAGGGAMNGILPFLLMGKGGDINPLVIALAMNSSGFGG